MLITTRLRDIRHPDHLNRYLERRIHTALDRVADRVVAVSAHVERIGFEVVCRLEAQLVAGIHVGADGRGHGVFIAIDRAVDALVKAVRRAFDKTRERRRTPHQRLLEVDDPDATWPQPARG